MASGQVCKLPARNSCEAPARVQQRVSALEPCAPGTLKSWTFETMETCNLGFLEPCNLWTLEPCDLRILQPWSSRSLELSTLCMSGTCTGNPQALPKTLNFGTLTIRIPWSMESWNQETWSVGSMSHGIVDPQAWLLATLEPAWIPRALRKPLNFSPCEAVELTLYCGSYCSYCLL